MSVRVCGHQLRLKKPIKPYTFFKNAAAVLVLSVILITPVYAADVPAPSGQISKQQASSASVPPCFPSKVSSMDKTVPRKGMASQTQRPAGSPSAAMVLAMALGMRNISGPMEQARPVQRAPQRQAMTLNERCVNKISGNVAPARVAMER